jgi:hypothetical protein
MSHALWHCPRITGSVLLVLQSIFFNKLGLRFLPAKRGSDHAGKDGKRCKKNVINGDTEREGGNGWIIGKTEYWVTTGFRANLD